MSRTEGDLMSDISRIMREQHVGYATAERVSKASYRISSRLAHRDPTPQEQWELTTPPEVYGLEKEEWLP